jgi:hypothetical protein
MTTELWFGIVLALWQALSSVVLGLGVYMLKENASRNKGQDEELLRQNILLNKTREELARDYITKVEVRSDMQQIINRFDRLEEKIDRVIEGHK